MSQATTITIDIEGVQLNIPIVIQFINSNREWRVYAEVLYPLSTRITKNLPITLKEIKRELISMYSQTIT